MATSPSTEIIVRDAENGTPAALLATEQMAKDRKELIRRTVAPDATPAELDLFIYDCLRRRSHPLDRMIHFTKRGGRYTPITGIDYMRSLAGETGEHAGTDDAEFVESEPFPKSAKVTVYRLTKGQRYAYAVTARWTEYYPGDGALGFMWRKMPHVMLAKVAESQALRKAFPRELGGLYEKAEMAQASSAVEVEPERVCLRCSALAEHDSDYCETCNRLHADRLADDALKAAGLKPMLSDDGARAGPVATPSDGERPPVKPPAPEPLSDVKKERTRLFALLNEYGWTTGDAGRPDRLRLYARALGRAAISEAEAKKLTAEEWRAITNRARSENEPPIEQEPPR